MRPSWASPECMFSTRPRQCILSLGEISGSSVAQPGSGAGREHVFLGGIRGESGVLKLTGALVERLR